MLKLYTGMSLSFAIFGLVTSSVLAQPVLTLIGHDNLMNINAVSPDGSTVCGTRSIFEPQTAFAWDVDAGLVWLQPDGGAVYSFPYGLSGDGAVVTGHVHDVHNGTPGIRRAAHWFRGVIKPQLLPLVGGYSESLSYAITPDAEYTVGALVASGMSVACRWDGQSPPYVLGALPGETTAFAQFVSDDGDSIVGSSGGTIFHWTPTTGMVAMPLAFPEGYEFAALLQTNDDATVFSGRARRTDPVRELPFIWRAGTGVELIEDAPAGLNFYAGHATSDADVIVGSVSAPGEYGDAVAWTRARGIINLNTYLPTIGVDMTGWTLTHVSRVNEDATTIAGTGMYNGAERSFVLTGVSFACGADFNDDGEANSQDFFDFLACFFDPTCVAADVNASGQVDSQDFFDFLTVFFAGCR